MVGLKNISHKKIKIFLLAMITITLAVIIAIFIGYRQILNEPDIPISSFKKDAPLALDRIRQTATKNGIKEWSMDAGSAYFNAENKQAFLKDVSVTFFLKNGRQVDVTADEGVLRTDTRDIEAHGNVVVKNRDYRLSTENIFYDHRQRLITSKTAVKIWSEAFHLIADSITFDLNTNRAALNGNVKGIFNENFQL